MEAALPSAAAALSVIIVGPGEAVQVETKALGREGDCLLAISTSGKSKSVLAAVEAARSRGMGTAALTGAVPNPLADVVDHCVAMPSMDTQAVQAGHLVAEHVLCRIIENRWSES